jgi:N-methylhydantoinase A
VTDAHVVLGRISTEHFLGGAMPIYPDRAEAAVAAVAKRMGTGIAAAAQGILRIANANMERAIRVVSVERGHDPRQFPLVAFGGCGGLHACEIAGELGIRTVLSPRFAGGLSALGMLLANRTRDYSAGALRATNLEARFLALEAKATQEIEGARLERLADVRYAGQSYELTVPWVPEDPGAPFHREHHKVYGYSDPSRSIEVVTVRLRATVNVNRPGFASTPGSARRANDAKLQHRAYVGGRWRTVPVYERMQVPLRDVAGPALILDYGSTTLVPDAWRFHMDHAGNILITQ